MLAGPESTGTELQRAKRLILMMVRALQLIVQADKLLQAAYRPQT